MDPKFPLNDVKVTRTTKPRSVEFPLYADSFWQMNQDEFAMQVEGVGNFYACNGREVEYASAEGAGRNEIELYLNGSAYGAILHQRKILPLHGSSFGYNGKTVLICGDTGTGKSSLTASFCLSGAMFLTDDITPVVFRNGIPYIRAMSEMIKLWGDTLEQLGRGIDKLERIYPEMDKYYYPVEKATDGLVRLDQVFLLKISEDGSSETSELAGYSLFVALRSQIYRPEYLLGMTDNEQAYFKDLIAIANNIRAWEVSRPEKIAVARLAEVIKEKLDFSNAADD